MIFACKIFAAILTRKRLARIMRFQMNVQNILTGTGRIAQVAHKVLGR